MWAKCIVGSFSGSLVVVDVLLVCFGLADEIGETDGASGGSQRRLGQ